MFGFYTQQKSVVFCQISLPMSSSVCDCTDMNVGIHICVQFFSPLVDLDSDGPMSNWFTERKNYILHIIQKKKWWTIKRFELIAVFGLNMCHELDTKTLN